ncbi:uncharacterized protein [Bos taurus]|uniref:uncharacterized protein isoform X2 n=1 Tax=Bos taurus TaxID=9913 RepID=UPI000383DB70|nr:uncharacterized protein LOC107132925 isoform X2 [Bos taurus]
MAPRFSRGKGQQEPLRPCRPDSQLPLTSPPNAPTLPTLYPPELARSPAAAATAVAVTTKDPPSCNPILSAFLFLLQQVRTGCPSRGYGGRRVQRVTPPFLHALPALAVLSILARRGSGVRWVGLSATSSSLGSACRRGLSPGGRFSRASGFRWCRETLLRTGGESGVVVSASGGLLGLRPACKEPWDPALWKKRSKSGRVVIGWMRDEIMSFLNLGNCLWLLDFLCSFYNLKAEEKNRPEEKQVA